MLDHLFKRNHLVKDFECDFQGYMKFTSLINHLIYVSSLQWNENMEALGKVSLASQSLTWVLIRYQADIHRMPRVDEDVVLTTEYKSYDKIFAYRNFDVYNHEDESLIHIESVFALLNMKTRRMVKMEDKYFEGFNMKEAKSDRIKHYPVTEPLDESQELLKRDYYVRYYDIDANQHVSNSLYMDWAIDVLGGSFLREHQMTYVSIKFDKEVYYDDYVLSLASLKELDSGQILSAHRIETEGKLNAEVEIHWKKIND